MTKQEMIRKEIAAHAREIERLKLLFNKIGLNNDDGKTIKECHECKTMNMHWDVSRDNWCCAYCGTCK